MPTENTSLYSRGKYRLERHVDAGTGELISPNFYIVWYDASIGGNRRKSTGASEIGAAEDALDRLYLERERGQAVCPTCNRPFENAAGVSVHLAIADYLLECEDKPSIGSIRARLAHFQDFMDATGRTDLMCEQVDDALVGAFRKWSASIPVDGHNVKEPRERSPGTTEASVRMLAAAINSAHRRKDTVFPATFKVLQPKLVSRTPQYRATIETLGAMFNYCLRPEAPSGEDWSEKMIERQKLHRKALLRFLQISVATWCRPDAAHDFSTDPKRDQWLSSARVVQLNPRGRLQTNKYRPAVPVPDVFARLLDANEGYFVPVQSVRKAFESMLDELGLPRERETGLKLIRRSVSQIARRRIGEAQWTQGRMMLGHHKASTSDLYALPDPANLGLALEATTNIINEISELAPGAFGQPVRGLRLVGSAN
ncbi:MAG: hypothetical protein VYD90_10520 [Pseudomonadota bacterium]|nr:hypothetical protein [Pseudomonadota bacterium]